MKTIKQISDMTDEEKWELRREFDEHKRLGMLQKQRKDSYKLWKKNQKKLYEKEFEMQQHHLFDIMKERHKSL